MRRILRLLWMLLLWGGVTVSLMLTVSAENPEYEAVTLPPSYADLENYIPKDMAGILPEGVFSENAEEALSAVGEMSDWRYLLNAVLSAVGLRMEDAIGWLCTLLGLVLVAAILGKLREGISGANGELLGLCLRLTLYTAISLQTVRMVETVQVFFSQLNALMGGLIPVTGVLYAMGGNLGQAALNGEITVILLAVCEYVSATVTPPVCALCMSFSLMDAFGLRTTLAPLCEQVKKWYVGLLGLIMFLLTLAISTQSILVGRADSLGMKGIKYAVGNMLPVIGGAVAGSLGTVAAGVGILRGICGVSGVILVALLLLPTLVHLLLFRAVIRLASTVAGLLGCEGESRLLTEMGSLHGYMAAAVSICSVTCILSLSLLIHSTAALA